MPVITRKFTIKNKTGLHARSAAKLVKFAAEQKDAVILIENLTRQTRPVNASSLILVLSISARQNDEVLVTIEGDCAAETMPEITRMFEDNFGEAE
jgi:phosphocarrier protein HPr